MINWRSHDAYKKQFSVSDEDDDYKLNWHFYDYDVKKALCHRIVSSNVKCKRKKDFLANHPEYEDYYSNLLVPNL